jgi:hypothetical protein
MASALEENDQRERPLSCGTGRGSISVKADDRSAPKSRLDANRLRAPGRAQRSNAERARPCRGPGGAQLASTAGRHSPASHGGIKGKAASSTRKLGRSYLVHVSLNRTLAMRMPSLSSSPRILSAAFLAMSYPRDLVRSRRSPASTSKGRVVSCSKRFALPNKRANPARARRQSRVQHRTPFLLRIGQPIKSCAARRVQ